MRKHLFLGTGLLSTLLLAGCASEYSVFGGSRANISGATSIVETAKLESIPVEELITVLDNSIPLTSPQGQQLGPSPTLQQAIFKLEERGRSDAQTKIAWAQLRNTVQDRILVASQSRCGFYEEYLKRFQSDSASTYGILSTVLGGAGAIVTGASGARLLSGLSGISSGIGAEIQKDLFTGLTSTVIVPGIEKRRHDIMTSIMSHRCLPPDRYSIGLALTEALAYHSACSMDAGIAEGANAIKDASTPGAAGLAALTAAAGQIGSAQTALVTIEKNRHAGAAKADTVKVSVSSSDNKNLFADLKGLPIEACPSANP